MHAYYIPSLKPIEKPVQPLQNHKSCLNPLQLIDKRDCGGCQFKGCVFEGRGEYRKYKL